jgi:hypothetical protein
MKKCILACVMLIFFCSCKIYNPVSLWEAVRHMDYILTLDRMAKKTEQTYCYGQKMPFVLNDYGYIFIPCKMNDTTYLLWYDSGISGTLFEKFSGSAKFPKSRITTRQPVMAASGKITVKTGLRYYDVESDIFNFKKLVGEMISAPGDTMAYKCIPMLNDACYLGLEVFPKKGDVMLLSFSDTTVMLLDSAGCYDTANFMSVKSRFYGNKIYIYLTVDSIEYEFGFDTGFNKFLSIPWYKKYKKCTKTACTVHYEPLYEKHQKENDVTIVGWYVTDLSGFVIDTITMQQTNAISMGDLDSIKGNINYRKKAGKPLIGMEFISHFDWIIDRHRKRIYVKKINDMEYAKIMNSYRVGVFDSTLQITLLPVGEIEYQLFSIIDSVNGEKVNAENICQMQYLLNKENGFKDNQIVILPPPKK